MAKKDVYERMCDFFGLQIGEVPDRDNLIRAFKQSLPLETATFYFLFPMFGEISESQLRKKARRKGYSQEEIEQHLGKLIDESFIEKHFGEPELRYARVFCVFVAENQVRKKKGTALGKRYAKFWMDLAEVSTYNLPTKTPYARVLAAEESIPVAETKERIAINESIEETSQAVPYDFVTEMLRNTERIALAECYCRLSMGMAGKPCEHEEETCFLFDEAARGVVEIGAARYITLEEALEIVRRCEDAGLVHNTNNAQGKITFMCNCCPCCCPILGALQKGLTNVGTPSHFVAEVGFDLCQACGTCTEVCYTHALTLVDGALAFEAESCIGCGLCAGRCPEGAITMAIREETQPLFKTAAALDAKIQREAILGKAKAWITGK